MSITVESILHGSYGVTLLLLGIVIGIGNAKLAQAGRTRVAWGLFLTFALICLIFISLGVLTLVSIWRAR